jgi:hypothetical protein
MDLLTYDGLVSATADYLNRADIDAQIPTFVTLATSQFNRELRLRDMQIRANTTSSAENVELPTDFLEHYSLTVLGGTSGWPLRYMSEKESNDIKAASHGTGGQPAGYTVIGNMIELIPAPGGDVDLRMVYYARIPELSAMNPSNWLLAKSPDVYLYSTLLNAEPYLLNDARLPLWAQLRTAIVEAMKLESEAALRPRSGMTAFAKAF